MFSGKSILITGGTGSFGKRFVATLLKDFQPARIVVYSRDELKQFEMQREFDLTCVLVTHNRALAASCDRSLRLQGGRLVEVDRSPYTGLSDV